MKSFRKIIALVLCLTMALSAALIPSMAAESEPQIISPVTPEGSGLDCAFAEGTNSLIVFVTGIGQSWSYLFDESYLEDGAFESGTLQDYENYAPLIAEGKASERWNLFNGNILDNLKDPGAIWAALKIVGNLLLSIVTRRNTVSPADCDTLVSKLFKYNLVDENGKCNQAVVTPRYTMPVSEYPGIMKDGKFESEAKNRFYRSIPCADIALEKLGENYEDYLYCYNYCAFSYTSNNVKGLHDFVETIIAENKVGATDVVLIPMSMGASVVSAYLAAYPDVADNHVRRVVSIVGCWLGSDVIYDLITKQYADNSPDLFYNGIIAGMIGEPWGNVVNAVLRIFPKPALRGFIDMAVDALVKNIVLDAPSLTALVPCDNYPEIRNYIKSDVVLKETDAYYQAQSTLQSRLAALEEQGVTFSFISGYGLPYGAITSDYHVFGFMYHAERTNSDEIINITSTAPGTSCVPYNQKFTDTDGRILSPDETIDISTAYYKDSCWYFYGQKHELEFNNTAISLAIELALGHIKTVADCDNPEEDEFYYPQFNYARNVSSLTRDYIPALEKYLEDNTITAEQQALYDEVKAMLKCTENNYDADNALIDEFYSMLVDLGIYSAPKEESAFNKGFAKFTNALNEFNVKVFGSKGFLDFFI